MPHQCSLKRDGRIECRLERVLLQLPVGNVASVSPPLGWIVGGKVYQPCLLWEACQHAYLCSVTVCEQAGSLCMQS